jgi:catechol 2,3-dioxygenase-like lactoylglutathione lyase family enzyme
MLASRKAIATVAVKDLPKARAFYEKTLGLSVTHTEGEEAVEYGAGDSTLLVYRSEFAGTNRATAVTWEAGDTLERVVADLKGKGVAFEHYEGLSGMTLDGDIHRAPGMNVAWFKDPDGNIHALISA